MTDRLLCLLQSCPSIMGNSPSPISARSLLISSAVGPLSPIAPTRVIGILASPPGPAPGSSPSSSLRASSATV